MSQPDILYGVSFANVCLSQKPVASRKFLSSVSYNNPLKPSMLHSGATRYFILKASTFRQVELSSDGTWLCSANVSNNTVFTASDDFDSFYEFQLITTRVNEGMSHI